MRTFFALDSSKRKFAIIKAISISWNRRLYSPGDFSIEMAASEFSKHMKFIYKDGGRELGIIQKYQYKYTRDKGKTVIISGNFMEALVNNVPVLPFDFKRQIDDVSGYSLCYKYSADGEVIGPPKKYAKKILTENVYNLFSGGDSFAKTTLRACIAVSQLAMHEYPKFLESLGLNYAVPPFDDFYRTELSQELLDKIFDENYYTRPVDDDTPDGGETLIDEYGRTLFAVPKGNTNYLGDILENWLNSCWITPQDMEFSDSSSMTDSSVIPPFRPYYACAYNPKTCEVTLGFSYKANVSAYEFSEEAGNIMSYDYSQDISSEPAGGIYRSVYLEEAKTDDTTTDTGGGTGTDNTESTQSNTGTNKNSSSDTGKTKSTQSNTGTNDSTSSGTGNNDSSSADNGEQTEVKPGSNYKCVESKALRDKYLSIADLPLNPLDSGKIVVECDYLGNTFEDLITENDCIADCYEKKSNFENASTTVSYNLVPVLPINVDYTAYFNLGDFVKVEGYYHRIVAISETISDGAESISLTLESEVKNMFKNYYNSTHSYFDGGITR